MFDSLINLLQKIPSMNSRIGSGNESSKGWWVKFAIDIHHPCAWHVVQELGHVLNYLSLDDTLPTVFKPVSPPPYMNGGPDQFLSWVIECHEPPFTPETCKEWLAGRLPKPIDDVDAWIDS